MLDIIQPLPSNNSYFTKEWEKITISKTGRNGILKMATCTSNKPFAVMVDDGYAGFDIAIANGFCEEYGYGLEIYDTDFSGMITGIAGGKFDLAASQIAYTKERAEKVLYSDFYYTQRIVAIIKSDNVPTENSSFIDDFKSGFKKTFIDEMRYLMIISGIKITLIITVFGFALAMVLGAFLCAMAMSRFEILRVIANIYSKVMQGTPIVVVLMIIYYIIFAKSDISNVLVAIIGFGASTAANISQIYVGAIKQVNIGEIEVAMALGFSKRESFMGIVLPQAVRTMLPSMGSQLVSLMKGTSIAAVYFIISTIILLIFDALVYLMNPENRKREVKGV